MKFIVIIGAQKCGTTTLFEMLQANPQISASKTKETNYFLTDGKISVAGYLKNYTKTPADFYLEASPGYTLTRKTALETTEKIQTLTKRNPNVEFHFVYVIRNPIDRIESLYRHAMTRPDFGIPNFYPESIDDIPAEVIESTCYESVKNIFRNRFGFDALTVVDFDELTQYPNATIKRIATAAGFLCHDVSRLKRANDSGYLIDQFYWNRPNKASACKKWRLPEPVRAEILDRLLRECLEFVD